MARKIVLTSGKGGVGKTTFTANLGYSLALLNKKVVMIDMDLGLNNLDVVCGVENQIIYDMIDISEGRCRVKQALIPCELPNLFILPTCNGYNKRLIDDIKLMQIFDVLSESFDYILIDCPAGIDEGFYKAIKFANEAIIITTPHISAIRDADKVLTILLSNKILEVGLVVNRIRGDLVIDGQMLSVENISTLIKCPLLGVIPESDLVTTNLNSGGFVKTGDVGIAYKMCANKLNFFKGEIFDATAKYKGIFGGLKRKLKRID